MSTIACYDRHGNLHHVITTQLCFRPAVFGVFIENSQVLLIKDPQTALWQLPGGMLAEHETPTLAVRFFIRQVTGIMPAIGALSFIEDRYLLDDDQQAWRLACLYYTLQRPSSPTASLYDIDPQITSTWLPLAQLQRENLQFGYEAIQSAHRHAAATS